MLSGQQCQDSSAIHLLKGVCGCPLRGVRVCAVSVEKKRLLLAVSMRVDGRCWPSQI